MTLIIIVVVALLASATSAGASASIPHFGGPTAVRQVERRNIPDPCGAAFPTAHRQTVGKTTWYNRQESVRMVLCYRFGLDPSADFPVSAGMVCGLLAQTIRKENLSLFVDGACSAADLASDPREPVKYLSVACGWASDLLGAFAKPAGVLGSLGCTLAPPVGHAIGSAFESKHEFDVAVDVVRRGKCIKYSPTHFGSPWLAEDCAPGDRGFSTLPRAPASGGGGAPGGGGSGGAAGGGAPSGGGGGGAVPNGDGTITLHPPSIVAGQWLYVGSNTRCVDPLTPSTVMESEILPSGAPIDGRNDSTHATYWISGTNVPAGAYGGATGLVPGNYEFATQCRRDGALVYQYRRAPLTITGPGRGVQISPSTVAPGQTISITPDQPCASDPGVSVNLYIVGPFLAYPVYGVDQTGANCDWGPALYSLPSDADPGEYRVRVEVFDPYTLEHGFSYIETSFEVS